MPVPEFLLSDLKSNFEHSEHLLPIQQYRQMLNAKPFGQDL
jgi:hypothetical protein